MVRTCTTLKVSIAVPRTHQPTVWYADQGTGQGLAKLREVQVDVRDVMDRVGMASAVDLGDPQSTCHLRSMLRQQSLPPASSLTHSCRFASDPYLPRNKREVARRLVLEADRLINGAAAPVVRSIRTHSVLRILLIALFLSSVGSTLGL
jgi:hypothetical protein